MRQSILNQIRKQEEKRKELMRISPYESPIDIKQISPVRYGNAPSQTADFYVPMAGADYPIMVVLHDNPYTGTTGDVRSFCLEMAKRKMAVWAVEVTKVDESSDSPFLVELDDVFTFFAWFEANSAKYHKPGPVILTGIGSGGLLMTTAVNCMYNHRMQEYWGDACPNMAAVCRNNKARKMLSGIVCVSSPMDAKDMLEADKYYAIDWLGADMLAKKGIDYLTFARNVDRDVPPCLFITSYADNNRESVERVNHVFDRDGMPSRLIIAPKNDENELLNEPMWNVYYPMWQSARKVNEQIAVFCHGLMEQ